MSAAMSSGSDANSLHVPGTDATKDTSEIAPNTEAAGAAGPADATGWATHAEAAGSGGADDRGKQPEAGEAEAMSATGWAADACAPSSPDKSEMTAVEAEVFGAPAVTPGGGMSDESGKAPVGHFPGSERASGGHVPSFLDSDFDEAEADGSESAAAPASSDDDVTHAELPPTPPATPETLPGHPVPGGTTVGPSATQTSDRAGAEKPARDEPSVAARARPRRPEIGEWRGIVLVTGTDTDVGKTITTAAVAAAAQASGLRVAVIKPGQTGIVTGAPTDIEVITRLAGPDTVRVLAEYPEPMSPLAAATIAEMAPLELYEVVDAIRAEADKHDLVLVEGAGGLLVQMGVRPSGEAWTLADLATTLGVGALVVARAGLGTLNHTALTLEALERRGVPAGVIIGAWPGDPQLVHWANLSELVPHLVGALPEGAGQMDPGVFRRSAPGWLTPAVYGVLDNWRVWAEEIG